MSHLKVVRGLGIFLLFLMFAGMVKADLIAADQADNPEYSDQFAAGDNGGYGFQPWVDLKGTTSSSTGQSLPGGGSRSWQLTQGYFGRGLSNAISDAEWSVVARHDVSQEDVFSGFNFKSNQGNDFNDGEWLRLGVLQPSGGQLGIYYSTNGAFEQPTYMKLCDVSDGYVNKDDIQYTVQWTSSGDFFIGVSNVTRESYFSASGHAGNGVAIQMFGMGVDGPANHVLLFDQMAVTAIPEPSSIVFLGLGLLMLAGKRVCRCLPRGLLVATIVFAAARSYASQEGGKSSYSSPINTNLVVQLPKTTPFDEDPRLRAVYLNYFEMGARYTNSRVDIIFRGQDAKVKERGFKDGQASVRQESNP